MKSALEMIESGKIRLKSMMTHRLRLEEIANAFRAARDTASSLKVIVKGLGADVKGSRRTRR